MLAYEEFKNEIRKETEQILGDRYKVMLAEGREKNLGIKETLEIFGGKTSGSPDCVYFYLNVLFNRYKLGMALHGIAGEIADIYRRREEGAVETARIMENIADFGKCRGRLYFKVVNTERNRELLKDVPHREVLDLSFVPYILLGEEAGVMSSVVVDNDRVQQWGVPAEDVMEQAYNNAPFIMPAEEAITMGDILEDAGVPGTSGRLPELYMLTNKRMVYGFAVVFYPGVLKAVADRFGRGFYIIPASPHQAMAAMEDMGITPQELKEVVRKVREEWKEEPEFLSDKIYFYDREKDELRMEGGGYGPF